MSEYPKLRCRSRLKTGAAAVLCALALSLATIPGHSEMQRGAEPDTLPFKREPEVMNAETLWRVTLALGVAVAIAFAAVHILKRVITPSLGRANATDAQINVVEIRRVTPRLTLFLIEIDGEKILITQSGDRLHPMRLRPETGEAQHAVPPDA